MRFGSAVQARNSTSSSRLKNRQACASHKWHGTLRGFEIVTGSELKQLRKDLGEAIGRELSVADMAKLCGLPAGQSDTIRRWEVSGPSGPAGELLRILAMASDHYPILENFNVFDRWDVPEQERPARRAQFRDSMREEVRRRLA
jgi:DNA-binding transcriptional regulator YiaG